MKLSISVVSRSRSYYGTTLQRLDQIPAGHKMPVYIYAHQQEQCAYQEMYPDFIVVPHNFREILKIRAFVQKHQYELGNDTIMLDDDIMELRYYEPHDLKTPWNRSFTEVIAMTKHAFENGADLAVGYNSWDHPVHYYYDKSKGKKIPEHEDYLSIRAVWVGLSRSLYDKGVYYGDSKTQSEDFFISFMPQLKDCKVALLDFVHVTSSINFSHFDVNFYYKAVIETYVNYGAVLDWIYKTEWQGFSASYVNERVVELTKKYGKPIYTPWHDEMLLELMDSTLLNVVDYLKEIEWKPAESYVDEIDQLQCREVFDRLWKKTCKVDLNSTTGNVIEELEVEEEEEPMVSMDAIMFLHSGVEIL
jgi:hypothetical protein